MIKKIVTIATLSFCIIFNSAASEPDNMTQTVQMLDDTVEVKSRPIENGNWLLYLSDGNLLLENAFNELGMLTCDPEFELFIKHKINELQTNEDLENSIIDFNLDCSGYYEIHIRDGKLNDSLFQVFRTLYKNTDSVMQETLDFKTKVKACLNDPEKIDSYICKELKINPLPTPEPRYLQTENGDVPMKGFSECYHKIISQYSEGIDEKIDLEAQKACYSSW